MKAQTATLHPHSHTKRKGRMPRRRTPPGAPPGTLIADPTASHPTIRVMTYGPQHFAEEIIQAPQRVRELLNTDVVTWVDVEGLGDVECIKTLGEIFSLHHLSLEDVINLHQRAKVEDYEHYLFIVARMAVFGEELETEQVSLFLGKNFVLTFQQGHPGDCLEIVRERLRKATGRIRFAGADYLAYALLDAVVDCYFPILEEYGERLEAFEDEILTQPRPDTIAHIHQIKRHLRTLRRVVWPLRETFNTLLRDETEEISHDTRLHLRDCYDHTVQLIDLIETYRELGADLTDVYLSSVGNRTNEIMRVLTIIATIFIPLTFIAGVYGMNFDPDTSPWNMPELRWYWGYPLSLTLMAIVAIVQLIIFWRRGWVGWPGFIRSTTQLPRLAPDHAAKPLSTAPASTSLPSKSAS
jgi:magnesium transporter